MHGRGQEGRGAPRVEAHQQAGGSGQGAVSAGAALEAGDAAGFQQRFALRQERRHAAPVLEAQDGLETGEDLMGGTGSVAFLDRVAGDPGAEGFAGRDHHGIKIVQGLVVGRQSLENRR